METGRWADELSPKVPVCHGNLGGGPVWKVAWKGGDNDDDI